MAPAAPTADTEPPIAAPLAAAEAPAVETPAVETPAVEAPAVEASAVDAPAVDVPGTEATPDEPEAAVAEPAAAEHDLADPDDAVAARDAADATDLPEQTIALETPTAGLAGTEAAAAEVATVPPSRREKALARREAREQAKAEKAALRDAALDSEERQGLAEKLVARLPTMRPAVAAIFTGVVAGLICVSLTWGEVATCEAIRGENNCNDGFGLLAVVVVLAIEIVIGAALLRAFQVSDPFSTSFLGVGLVAMVVMLTFMGDDAMISPLMIVVIPALTAAAFLLSWWVTVRFIEEPNETS